MNIKDLRYVEAIVKDFGYVVLKLFVVPKLRLILRGKVFQPWPSPFKDLLVFVVS